jgi:thiol:disulfide interchange protein DsbD
MQKILKFALLLLLGTGTVNTASAQVHDPTTWTYEVKKIGGDKYELIFHLALEEKWHIWSVKPGGDGFQIPPTFKFNQIPGLKTLGPVKETGKPITETMDGVDGAVTYFSGKVDYVQTVTVKGKTKITGSHEYQVCSDNICLPPKTLKFEFDIK